MKKLIATLALTGAVFAGTVAPSSAVEVDVPPGPEPGQAPACIAHSYIDVVRTTQPVNWFWKRVTITTRMGVAYSTTEGVACKTTTIFPTATVHTYLVRRAHR